jgi:hypothetical protein
MLQLEDEKVIHRHHQKVLIRLRVILETLGQVMRKCQT